MKNKNIFIWVVMIVLLMQFVYAIAPQIGGGDSVLEVIYPQYDYVPIRNDFELYTKVFNKTTGVMLTNETTSCELHLAFPNGTHATDSVMGYVNELNDFYLSIDSANFSVLGTNSFLIHCNTSGAGGYASGVYKITKSGYDEEVLDGSSGIAIVIFLLTLIIGLILLSMKKEFVKHIVTNFIIKRGLLILGLFLLMMATAMVATIAEASHLNLTNELFRIMWIVTIAGRIGLILFVFGTLVQILKLWQEQAKLKRMGGLEDD